MAERHEINARHAKSRASISPLPKPRDVNSTVSVQGDSQTLSDADIAKSCKAGATLAKKVPGAKGMSGY